MSANRDPFPIDAATAERLLRGEPVAGHHRLVEVLAAARAPSAPGELSGEGRALLAFRDARISPFPTRRRFSMLVQSAIAKILTVKAAALVMSVGGVGGVALAASTGNLPEPVQRHLPGVAASATHRPHPSGAPSGVRPSGSAQPLGDLCRRYAERDNDHRRSALDSDADFKPLVDQAGTRDRDTMDKFCADLRSRGASGAPSIRPSGPPPARPSGQPGERPSGQPSGQPSGGQQPEGQRSGAPAAPVATTR